ncbi:hypothetical protein BC826DRAFT_704541 [Russula brevipes]|nr:hypothetical protein BC826DRAFT_704541 [Russula brevipes]
MTIVAADKSGAHECRSSSTNIGLLSISHSSLYHWLQLSPLFFHRFSIRHPLLFLLLVEDSFTPRLRTPPFAILHTSVRRSCPPFRRHGHGSASLTKCDVGAMALHLPSHHASPSRPPWLRFDRSRCSPTHSEPVHTIRRHAAHCGIAGRGRRAQPRARWTLIKRN